MLNRLKRFITVSALSNTVMIFVIILILISANLGSGFSSAVDIFHEGEMLGNYWHMQDYYRGKSNFPLVIHGAMDYWPSLFAGLIFGEDKIIYGTRLIVVVTTTISWGIFVFTGISILSRNSKNNLLILVFVAIFCLTLPIFSLNVMAIEESPVGLRDPFLLLQMLLLIHYYISKESKVFFLAAMFALLPITLYWSYDRGVAAVLACMSLLMYLIYSKQYREFFASIFALVISVTLLEITNIAGSLVENLSNVLYWSGASGEVWGTKFNPNLQSIGALLKSFAIWLPLIFVGTVFGLAYISNKIDKNTVPVGIILFVFVIELILIKSAYNRPNLHRGLMSVWPSILLFL